MTTHPGGEGRGGLLVAALDYARRGWPVFPCSPSQKKSESKQPLTPKSSPGKKDGGLYLATTDEEQIRAWWQRFPHALIGMPTGIRSGLFVVDLDPRKFPADEMLAALAAFCGQGALPPCPVVRTQSGGLHLWFAYPEMPDGERLGNRANLFGKLAQVDAAIAEHVDIRGEGGYVIVPPSVMGDGAAYAWEQEPDGAPIPEAPPRLLDLVLRRGAFARGLAPEGLAPEGLAPHGLARGGSRDGRPPAIDAAPQAQADEAVRRYGLAALDRETQELASCPKGRRGFTLNKCGYVLGQLVAAGALSHAVVIAALKDACARNGLPAADGWRLVNANIERSVREGMASPRDLSEVERKARARAARAARSHRGPPDWHEALPFDPDDDPDPGTPFDGAWPDDGGYGGPPGGDGDDLDPEKLGRCAEQPQNDTGNGQRLLEWFGEDLLQVRDVGWHAWAASHWEVKGGDEYVTRCAQEVAERIAYEADLISASPAERRLMEAAKPLRDKPEKDWTEDEQALVRSAGEIRDAVEKRQIARRRFAVSSGNNSRIMGMISQALPHKTVAPEDLDPDPLRFNVQNGTLVFHKVEDPEGPDLDEPRWDMTVELKPHARADLITKVAPVRYDRAATCPRWMAFLNRFLPDAAVREFVQVYSGYGLTGLTGEQVLVFMYGTGANGKSTFIEALCRLMGAYAQSLNPEAVTGMGQRRGDQATPELARLTGARLVRVSELPRGEPLREGLIKALTGGEPTQVRHLHKGFFDMYPTFKAVMSGNDLPQVGGVDHGIWRRLRLIPWTVTITDAERRPMEQVLAEFEAERAGILNWLIEGLRKYMTQGLHAPPEVLAATLAYREEMDPVGGFTTDCVERVPKSANASVTAREMYEAFVAWCHANAVRPWKEATFGRVMPQKGFIKTNERIRRYLDVRLHDVPKRRESGPPQPPHPADADEDSG